MNLLLPRSSRRQFLERTRWAAALAFTPGLLAEALQLTPSQTEGPFYPDRLPLDTDNDLVVINNSLTSATGEISYVSGRILDSRGDPIRNAVVEIWQCDARGAYRHSADSQKDKLDPNFQGYGRFLTGSTGEYLFRTIKPVPYPGRTPHIHYKVRKGGTDLLTTQCYVEGHAGNERDGLWKSLRAPEQRKAVTVPFVPLPGAKAGELAARFDLVVGVTPEA